MGRGALVLLTALLGLGGRGGDPSILYGFAFSDAGDSTFVRVELDWEEARMTLAPFGERPTTFTSVAVAEDSSRITFTWPGRVHSACSAARVREAAWVGRCVAPSGDARPIGFDNDYPWDLGGDLDPSEEDVEILDRASELLAHSDWNRGDERVCTDDRTSGRYSLFCALYEGSMQVTGRYLHRRPAPALVRHVIHALFEDRVRVHTLQDFNNDERTSRADLEAVIAGAREELLRTLRAGR